MRYRFRRLVLAGFVAGPLIAAATTPLGGWRYAAGLETGLYLFTGLIMAVGLVALAMGQVPESAATLRWWRWSLDVRRHRLAFGAVALLFVIFALGRSAMNIADWVVPVQSIPVQIRGSFTHPIRGYTNIYTDRGRFQTPLFAVIPDVTQGPATLWVGAVSGHVLAVVQAAP